MRGFSGLINCLKVLDAEPFCWVELLEKPFISLEGSALYTSKNTKLCGSVRSAQEFESRTEHLYIRLLNNGVEVVFFEMPARSVEFLADLVPEHVRSALISRSIDLGEIGARVLETGLKAQILFEDAIDSKKIKIWLE
jgi:hypothetical protein